MRIPALVIGIILLLAGALISAGVLKFETTEQVVDIGPIEVNRTQERQAPLNLGWILLGIGAVAVVIGVASKK